MLFAPQGLLRPELVRRLWHLLPRRLKGRAA
jgi:hypothetical protein